MNKIVIQNATIVNEGRTYNGSVRIEGEQIKAVCEGKMPVDEANVQVIDATDMFLLPGVIDDQVHFREPGFISASRD